MIRESLLYLSDHPRIREIVSELPAAKRVTRRFVAGETLPEAVQVAKSLNAAGLSVTLDHLGEAVSLPEDARVATVEAVRMLETISSGKIQANISLKPTQLGLAIDESLCVSNLRRILERARELGDGDGEIFVRLDMESSEFTEQTVSLVETFWGEGFRNIGTVVQSYLHRAPIDIDRLVSLGSRIRLVKGAYRESDRVAFQKKDEVDRKFVEQMGTLLEADHCAAIATHDEEIIAATRQYAFEHGILRNSFEFQMLYGVRRDLQQRLREEGYNVRVYLPFGGSWYPYLMRRMAERPANLFFVLENVARESSLKEVSGPLALGSGFVLGALATRLWRQSRQREDR
ncbi:MAG: proline dehydrogenase family protein [Gemmatimonadota bacterium]|jgi:proline dehydrogenase|nr:proline dehydrogenase family protein [Gemmatimonadota bacterium]